MKSLILSILLSISVGASAQIDLTKIANDITNEGKYLYQLETAAWNGTDIFRKSFKEPERIGGYFSFIESGKAKCLIFSKGEKPKVIGIVSFGDIGVVETATINFKERDFNDFEKDIYTIRQKTLAEVKQDSLFKAYNNTNLNLIPVINGENRRVYALTAPRVTGTVLFGNDYLLQFDRKNNIVSKEALHQNLIPIHYNEETEAIASVHSHSSETDDFITSTDICTLMLYAKYAGWKQHIVLSRNYVSIWDCETETLKIITREEYEQQNQ